MPDLFEQLAKVADQTKYSVVGLHRKIDAFGSRGPDPRQTLIRVLTAHFVARNNGTETPVEAATRLYGPTSPVVKAVEKPHDFLRRAVTNPAMTTVPGWAMELVGNLAAGPFELLAGPKSAYAQLAARSTRVSASGGKVPIPKRNGTNEIAAGFVGEAAQIPTRRAGMSSTQLMPKKMGVISFFSAELAKHSAPSIESVIRVVMAEDSGQFLDGVLLGSGAGTGGQPPGLFFGATPIPPSTGGGASACVADISALLGAISPAADPVLLMDTSAYVRLLGSFPVTAVSWPVIATDAMPPKTVGAIDAGVLVTAEDDDFTVDVGKDAVLVNVDSAPGLPVARSPLSAIHQRRRRSSDGALPVVF